MAKKIKYFLFVFLLFTFSLGEIARYQLQGGIAVKALDIGVFLFIFLSLSFARVRIKRSPLLKPVLIFFSVAVLSLIVNFSKLGVADLSEAILYLVRWILYTGVYFVVYSLDVKLKNKIPNMLLVSGAFIVFIGFLQYFLYPDLRSLMYMGWDEHFYRLFSIFLDPNFAGFFLVLYFLFLLGQIFRKKSLISQALLVITFFAIILTFSRSSYLMLIVGLFIFLFLEKRKRLIFYFGLAIVFTILAVSFFGAKSEGTNLLRTTSALARVEAYQSAGVIIKNNPIIGVGFNAYESASKRYGFSKQSKYPDHGASSTDNSFLFVLATTGIVGFVAYLYLWFKIIYFNQRNKNKFSTVIISSSGALFVGSFFINGLFYSFIMIWMWVLLGLDDD